MKRWQSVIDQKICEAMEQGEFDNLPGKGEPVDLSVNLFEDPELRMAHRILRSAGFAPSWIEERKSLKAFRAQAAQLNHRIAAWNLKVPVAGFQRRMIDAKREIERVRKDK